MPTFNPQDSNLMFAQESILSPLMTVERKLLYQHARNVEPTCINTDSTTGYDLLFYILNINGGVRRHCFFEYCTVLTYPY